MGDLTRNLSWREVLRGSGYDDEQPMPAAVRERMEWAAAHVFQPLRDAWGAPLRVISGVREKHMNEACGGATNSRHVVGDAFDLKLVGDMTDARYVRLYDLIAAMQKDGRLPKGGLGIYVSKSRGHVRFLHVDARERRARWNKTHLSKARGSA